MAKKKIALIGLDPSGVDFTKPDYTRFAHLGPDGLREMLEKDRASLDEAGFDAELVFLPVEAEPAKEAARMALASKSYDCILIGNGVRSLPSNFLLFEALINVVHEHARQARICFNTKPDDSAEAVLRWIVP